MAEFRSPFTVEELAAAKEVPFSQEHLFGALRLSTFAYSWVGNEMIHKAIGSFVGPLNDEENALGQCFYRLLGLIQTAANLTAADFQTLAMTTRTIFEIALDVDLLVGSHFSDGVERFHAHTRVARFRSAEKRVAFYSRFPELEDPGDARAARALASNTAVKKELEVLCDRLWHVP